MHYIIYGVEYICTPRQIDDHVGCHLVPDLDKDTLSCWVKSNIFNAFKCEQPQHDRVYVQGHSLAWVGLCAAWPYMYASNKFP